MCSACRPSGSCHPGSSSAAPRAHPVAAVGRGQRLAAQWCPWLREAAGPAESAHWISACGLCAAHAVHTFLDAASRSGQGDFVSFWLTPAQSMLLSLKIIAQKANASYDCTTRSVIALTWQLA